MTNPIPFLLVLGALQVAACDAPAVATDKSLAFVGEWECQPGTFKITENTYQVPFGDPIPIRKVEKNGNWYVLSFDDGYRVSLIDVSKTNMTWHSPLSGDTFACLKTG